MNYDIEFMLQIYQTYEYDWLGDKINNINKLTKHHIVKKEHGGENGISNYALLTGKSHKLIHLVEEEDPDLFAEINALFLELNRSVQPPTEDYYRRMDRLVSRISKKTKSQCRKK